MPISVRLLQLFAFLNRLELWDAVYGLFMLRQGFTLGQLAVLSSLWYVTSVLFEVPTGAFADRYGMKLSLLLSLLLQALAFWLMAATRSFPVAALAFLLWGLSCSFETGTYSALLYDSLKEAGREQDYGRIHGQLCSLQVLASALGGALAGQIATRGLGLPLVSTAALALLLCPLVLLLHEPHVAAERESSYGLQIRESVGYVSRHRVVALLLLYAAVMGAVGWGLRIFYQPLMDSFRVPVQRIGLFYLLFNLTGAAGALYATRLYRVLGLTLMYLMPLALLVAVTSLGVFVTPGIVGLIAVPFLVEGMYESLLDALLNERIPSGKRATILSVNPLISGLLAITTHPILGRIGDKVSLQMVFLVVAAATLLSMALILALLRREAAEAWSAPNASRTCAP